MFVLFKNGIAQELYLQFLSHSFDSISCQFIIPPQFLLKVENSRIIPIQKFQFQCPDMYHLILLQIYIPLDISTCIYTLDITTCIQE